MNTSTRPMRILIADDDPDVLNGFAAVIRSLGHHCDTAETGTDLRKLIRKKEHEILFMDLIMPDNDPEAVLKSIVESDNELEVVIVSAQDDEQEIDRILHAGAAAYLVKPVDFDILTNTIARIAERLDGGSCKL